MARLEELTPTAAVTGVLPDRLVTVVVACRNLAIALLRRSHCPNIAAALRTNAGRPYRAVRYILARSQPGGAAMARRMAVAA